MRDILPEGWATGYLLTTICVENNRCRRFAVLIRFASIWGARAIAFRHFGTNIGVGIGRLIEVEREMGHDT